MPDIKSKNNILLNDIKVKSVSKRKVCQKWLNPRTKTFVDKPTKPHKRVTLKISDGVTEVIIELDVHSLQLQNGTDNFLKDLLQFTKKA